MKPLTSSIRRQLLCWLLIPILTLWVIGAAITYILAMDFANNAYDNVLLDSARAVSSRLLFKSNEVLVDLPPSAQSILKFNEKDEFFYQVLTSNGRLVQGDDSVPPPAWSDLSKEPSFRDEKIGANEVRVVSLEVPIPGHNDNRFVVIQVAETLQGRQELTDNVILGVVLPQLVLIILAALAVWFGVTRGLLPLKEVQNAVSSRSPTDLRPLYADEAPKEVKPLVNAINELLMRLREDREAQTRFVANAAHQLRTPLAGLKTQTELAEREQDTAELKHSLLQIRTSADRATRLVHQLLALARVEPAAFKATRREPVSLNSIARDATSELVPMALAKNIDLGFEGDSGGDSLMGNVESLHELTINLLENAILYTPSGGKVTVRAENSPRPRLEVEDNGPGIPESERERVFERFYRTLGQTVHGSGLGLAIVREIADSHGATVELAAGAGGAGTTVTVEFPPLSTRSNNDEVFAVPPDVPFVRI